jgi:hypothetical protein
MVRRYLKIWLVTFAFLVVACDSSPSPNPIPLPITNSPSRVTPAVVPTTQPSSTPIAPTATGPITKLGIHLLLHDEKRNWPTSVWPEHLRYARELVGEWGYVVVVIRLNDLEVEKWQSFLDQCARLHLTPIFRFATFYDRERKMWSAPLRDNEKPGGYFTVAEQYRDFLDQLKWPLKQRLIIVGNEPNRGDEWDNQPNGEAYAHFLGDVSKRLRENDPNVVILNAALDLYAPNTNGKLFNDGYRYVDADTFLKQMVKWDKDIFTKVQIWNAHAYPLGPFRDSPDKQQLQFDFIGGVPEARATPWPNGLFNRGINSYAWELFRIGELGGPQPPVMITETGWRHLESTAPDASDAHGAEVSAAQLADYFELAFLGNRGRFPQYAQSGWTPWQDDARVTAVIPFALDGFPLDWGHSNWLMLDENGAVQGVYPQFQRMLELNGKK